MRRQRRFLIPIAVAAALSTAASCGSQPEARSAESSGISPVPTTIAENPTTSEPDSSAPVTTTQTSEDVAESSAPPTTEPVLRAVDVHRMLTDSPTFNTSDYTISPSPQAWSQSAAGVLGGDVVGWVRGPVEPYPVENAPDNGVELIRLTAVAQVRVTFDRPFSPDAEPIAEGITVDVPIAVAIEPAEVLDEADQRWIERLIGSAEPGTRLLVAYGVQPTEGVVVPTGIDSVIIGDPAGIPRIVGQPDGTAFGLDSIDTVATESTERG